jgi:hypothetical protein
LIDSDRSAESVTTRLPVTWLIHFTISDATRARHLADLAEQRDLQLLLRAGDRVPHREGLRLSGG